MDVNIGYNQGIFVSSVIPSQLKWAQVDHTLRYVPVLSTFVSLANLFQKAIFACCAIDKEEKNIYFTYIKDKNLWCCAILLIPIIGNLFMLALDQYGSHRVSHFAQDPKNRLPAIRLAKWGNADAMHYLGKVNREKNDIQYSYLAAARGDSRAMADLGFVYEHAKNNLGGPNSDLAMMWLQLAAEKGDAYAMYALGYRYETSSAMKDLNQAAYWYREAVKHGHNSQQKLDNVQKQLESSQESINRKLPDKEARSESRTC